MRLALALIVLVAGLGVALEQGRSAGSPLYPDLRTAPPTGLYFDTEVLGDGRIHYVLRFDNTVENHGGPLEITADLRQSRYVYQNVYDQYTGGTLVQNFRVGSDLIYHPSHAHFHFQDFASYHLLKKDTRGVYRGTTRRGSKASFCIVDSARVRDDIGPPSPGYEICDDQKQGLSAGWGDVYLGQLPEQWIDVGTTKLADGDYAIKSTANPLRKLSETDNANNAALTYFTVRNGVIITTGIPPSCDMSPASGPVGTPIFVTCTGFTPGQTLNIYWGSVNTTPQTTATAGVNGVATATFIAPEGAMGNHYVIGRPVSGGAQAATLFATTASLSQNFATGPVGTTVNLQMFGFAVSESVAVTYFKTISSPSTLATVPTSTKGSANLSIAIPASTFGAHKIEAAGLTSGAKAAVTFTVQPSLLLLPNSGEPGGFIGASLRGFTAYETVTLRLDGSTTLRTVAASSTGSTTASTTQFTIPAGTDPGPHQVVATGGTSGASASTTLTIVAPSASEAETPTPTPEPTATPTETPVPTEPAAPTETATPTETPISTESPIIEPSPTSEALTPEPSAPASSPG